MKKSRIKSVSPIDLYFTNTLLYSRPLKWLRFFTVWWLPLFSFWRILYIIQFFFSMGELSTNDISAHVFCIICISLLSVSVGLAIKTRKDIKSMSPNAYKSILILLLMDFLLTVLNTLFVPPYNENIGIFLGYTIPYAVLFTTPNIIYFRKRRSLFSGVNLAKAKTTIKTETQSNKISKTPSKKSLVKNIAIIMLPIMAIAIAIQLLYVPHRVYDVEFSSQNVPHYTFEYVRYNWITEDYHYTTSKGKISGTSKIAYDIMATQIFVTLLIGFSIYALLYLLFQKRKDKQQITKDDKNISNSVYDSSSTFQYQSNNLNAKAVKEDRIGFWINGEDAINELFNEMQQKKKENHTENHC